MDRSRTWLTMLALAILVSACSGWRETSHDWLLTEFDGAVLSLAVAVGSSSCNRFERLMIEETDQSVTITAVVETRTGFPFEPVCTGDMRSEAVTAFLDEPLGERQLLGCAPGPDGMQNYFGPDRQGDDCAGALAAFP